MRLPLRRKRDESTPTPEAGSLPGPAFGLESSPAAGGSPDGNDAGVSSELAPESPAPTGRLSKSNRPGAGGSAPSVGVNLLPPEIRLRAASRRAQIQGGLVVVVALLVLIAAFASSSVGKTSAEVELGEAQRKLAAVEVERGRYRDVPGVYAAIAAARAELATAMSEEVLFSTLLANLVRIVPAPAAMTSVNYTVSGADPKSKAKSPPAPGQQATYGTAGFTGRTTSMQGVAAVLDAITAAPEYTDVRLDGAQRGGEKGDEHVEFTISAQLTDKALSHRFQNDPALAPSASASAPPPAGKS